MIRHHLDALLLDARARKIPTDIVGRALLDEVIALWLRERPASDIGAELQYVIDNLDPDKEHAFMRP